MQKIVEYRSPDYSALVCVYFILPYFILHIFRGFFYFFIFYFIYRAKVKRSRSPAERVQSSSLHVHCLPFKCTQRTNTVPALPWAVFDTLCCAWTLPLLLSV